MGYRKVIVKQAAAVLLLDINVFPTKRSTL